MHELGIAFHIIGDIDKIAEENNIKQVKSITLELGEVSGVVPQYLVDVWNWACEHKSQHMKGCKLNLVIIKGITFCNGCKKTYSTLEGKTCPHCGSKETWLVQGNETKIKSIEVVDS